MQNIPLFRRAILDQADEAETDQEFSQNEPDKNFDQFR